MRKGKPYWMVLSLEHVRNGICANVWCQNIYGEVRFAWSVGPADPFAMRSHSGIETTLEKAKSEAESVVDHLEAAMRMMNEQP